MKIIDFPTTAARVAYTWIATDRANVIARDLEASRYYMVVASGAGVACFVPLGYYKKSIPVPLPTFRICGSTSDVGAIAVASGNGGQLASDSDPILRGRATVNNQELSWAANSVVAVMAEVPLPYDLDDTQDVTLELVINSGTTDAATMTVATTWDGGTEVADSASDTATKSATDHTITATIDKADVPAGAKHLSLRLTPPAHSTNAIQLSGVRLIYVAK